jgi:DNA-binding MarR family transcriptional regulator
LSSDSHTTHAEILEKLAFELRQLNGIGASFFRVAATQTEMAVTDIQVLDLLDLSSPSTAGQLAELTGLTTGAITRILDRLEKAGLVRRARDPNDGRKVIVHLIRDKEELPKVRFALNSIGKVWGELASRYDDEQIAFFLDFLQRTNTLSRQELVRLQEVSGGEGGLFFAPRENQESGRLVVSCSIFRLSLRANDRTTELYQANFEGPLPRVKTKEGVVTIRYPRRLLGLGEKQGTANIALSAAIPWQIVIQGGAAEVAAELDDLDLAGLEVAGGYSMIHLTLPTPTAVVPIQIKGGASEITVQHPVGVAVQVTLKGRVNELVFDNQTFREVGNKIRLQGPDFDPTAPRYDIEITGYTNKVTITSG